MARFALEAAILEIAHLVWVAAAQHFVHEIIIIAGIVARIDVFEAFPMLDKDLFEDIGGLASLCQHQSAPSEGMELEGMECFYHVSRSDSTPHRFSPCLLIPLSPWKHGEFRATQK